MNIKKAIIVTAIVGGIGYLIYKGTQKTLEAKAFVNNLNFDIKVASCKVQNSKIVLKLNIDFINPSKMSVSFQKPNVIINYNGSELTRSKISTDIVTIKAQSTSRLSNMTFEIPLMTFSMLSIVADMLAKITEGVRLDRTKTVAENAKNIVAALSDNAMKKLLPLLEVKLLTYIGDNPIEYTTKLV